MEAPLEKKSYRKNWDEVSNLRFLVRFFEETNMSISQAADVLGSTRQSVYFWLVKDDARFSVVNDLIEKCGYSLSFELIKKRVEDSLISIEVPHKKDEKRLSFFSDALKKYGITKEDLSSKLDIGLTAVYYWFRVDDCFISYIFKTAQLYDLNVKIHIRPKNRE